MEELEGLATFCTLDRGPRYLGGRKQIWSGFMGSTLIFKSTPLWIHCKKTSTLFPLDLRFFLKIHQLERWRGRPSGAVKRHSLAEVSFSHSYSTSNKVEHDKKKSCVVFVALFICFVRPSLHKLSVLLRWPATYSSLFSILLKVFFFFFLKLLGGKKIIPAVGFKSHLQGGLWYTGSSVAARQRKVKAGQEQWGYRQI